MWDIACDDDYDLSSCSRLVAKRGKGIGLAKKIYHGLFSFILAAGGESGAAGAHFK